MRQRKITHTRSSPCGDGLSIGFSIFFPQKIDCYLGRVGAQSSQRDELIRNLARYPCRNTCHVNHHAHATSVIMHMSRQSSCTCNVSHHAHVWVSHHAHVTSVIMHRSRQSSCTCHVSHHAHVTSVIIRRHIYRGQSSPNHLNAVLLREGNGC